MMNKEGRTAVEDAFTSFEIDAKEGPAGQVMEVRRQPGVAAVQIQRDSNMHNLQVIILFFHLLPFLQTNVVHVNERIKAVKVSSACQRLCVLIFRLSVVSCQSLVMSHHLTSATSIMIVSCQI